MFLHDPLLSQAAAAFPRCHSSECVRTFLNTSSQDLRSRLRVVFFVFFGLLAESAGLTPGKTGHLILNLNDN